MRKLTLSAEPEVIAMAKKLAARRRTSVSAMFSQIIRAMDSSNPRKGEIFAPLTHSVAGIAKLPRGKTAERVLDEALMGKYGK